jgi:F0F1-type ATP synthase membrane subunit b/b'
VAKDKQKVKAVVKAVKDCLNDSREKLQQLIEQANSREHHS